jgi:capsular polysaccharide biosynthesis protein
MEPFRIGRLLTAPLRHWWLTLVILIGIMAAAYTFTSSQQPTYLARATFVVGPSQKVEPGSLVYSVDSLGRGRIMGTYAEVLGSDLIRQEALERLGYAADITSPIILKSSTVADTTVVQITVESHDPNLSAEAANIAGDIGVEQMAALYPVYSLTRLAVATPPLTSYRPDYVRNYSLALTLGLGLAFVATYLFDLLLTWGSSRVRRNTAIGDPEPRAVAAVGNAARPAF